MVNNSKKVLLIALGQRVKAIRARRGMTRKTLAQSSRLSERYLASLEYGEGNASILALAQVAEALQCPLAELIGDVTTSSAEWLLIREMLSQRTEDDLYSIRQHIATTFHASPKLSRNDRIALIGLRGAGKSTLGQKLALDLDYPFVELSRKIEEIAGLKLTEIYNLYGENAYRRYERRAIADTLQNYDAVVIATPGGIVSDSNSFNKLLAQCYTIWLQANPEDHLARVAAQGDTRPMEASTEALDDLKLILQERSAFYNKADKIINTSAQSLHQTFQILSLHIRKTSAQTQ